MEILEGLIFASDAELLALWGLGFLLLAAFATFMEKRRTKRSEFDRVGWVPWFGIFFVSVVFGGGLLALAVPSILRG